MWLASMNKYQKSEYLMNNYIEITLINGEKPLYELWSDLYTQIHISIVHIKKDNIDIGVSFPKYYYFKKSGKIFAGLGDKVRIFANDKEILDIFLKDLQIRLDEFVQNWDDVLHIKSPKTVPEHSRFVCVRRHRPSDLMEQATRFAKFKSIDLNSAILHCQTHKRGDLGYPYIKLLSQSTQKPYRLHIVQTVVDNPKEGAFGSYGINNAQGEATVPHW